MVSQAILLKENFEIQPAVLRIRMILYQILPIAYINWSFGVMQFKCINFNLSFI